MLISSKKTLLLIVINVLLSIKIYSTDFIAQKATCPITIDGMANEACWEEATWYPMDQVWIPYGAEVPESDFSGRFKLIWSDEKLYLLAEIIDDSLSDDHSNILESYWEDDCLEIFIDENASGGDHTNNFNAFAYHISTLYDAIDLNASGDAEAFSDHVEVMLSNINDTTYLWEVALDVYDDTFTSTGDHSPVTLSHNKSMGFSLAYCDNDETTGRENFFASTEVPEANYNDHWKNASFFGNLTLIDSALVDPFLSNSLENTSSKKSNIYPNPANRGEMVYIGSGNNVSIECFSLSGQLIFGSGSSVINTTNLQTGTYVIKISTSDNCTIEKLMIK